jgi:photosystem II stability/assembly factor-like uncharacterized protein
MLGGTPESWVPANGLPPGYLRGLSLDRGSPGANRTLFITANGDVYRSQDDGMVWTLVLDSDSCRTTAVDRIDGALVYAGGEGGLWRSLASGAPGSWSRVGPPAMAGENLKRVEEERWDGVHRILPVPGRPGWAFVAAHGAGRGLYRTTDGGLTWIQLKNATYMRDVAIDPTDPNVIYAAASRAFKSASSPVGSEGLERSEDGGQTWTSLNDGLAWPFAARIVIDPANNRRLILGSPGNGFFERTLPGASVAVEPPVARGDASLSDARPNPSRGAVAFTLQLARPARVEWSVHDLQGRTIWSGAQDCVAGASTLAFDLAPAGEAAHRGGVYFARVTVEGRVLTRRFALLK